MSNSKNPEATPCKPTLVVCPYRFVVSLPEQSGLLAEEPELTPRTALFSSKGKWLCTLQTYIEYVLRRLCHESQLAMQASPDKDHFTIESELRNDNEDAMLYVHKEEPSMLRPIHRMQIGGQLEYTNWDFSRQIYEHDIRFKWRTGPKKCLSIRFGVRLQDGSGYSNPWMVWTLRGRGKSDVYIKPKSLESIFKVSLHESGSWQLGFTQEFLRRHEYSHIVKQKSSRHWEIWNRPIEISAGVTLAMRLLVAGGCARQACSYQSSQVTWVDTSIDEAAEFSVLYTAPGTRFDDWPSKQSMNTRLAGRIELENGESVWVVYRTVPLPTIKNLPTASNPLEQTGAQTHDKYSALIYGMDDREMKCLIEAPAIPRCRVVSKSFNSHDTP